MPNRLHIEQMLSHKYVSCAAATDEMDKVGFQFNQHVFVVRMCMRMLSQRILLFYSVEWHFLHCMLDGSSGTIFFHSTIDEYAPRTAYCQHLFEFVLLPHFSF